MKSCLLLAIVLITASMLVLPTESAAQGNITWEEIWVRTPPPASPDTVFNHFMRDPKGYTGIAYDKFRQLLYIVSPQQRTSGTNTWNCPRIYIWDANTGEPAWSIGRSADTSRLGLGGELPVPRDTIVPSMEQYGFERGKFCIYKIDVDDEGRIFVCNLVAPVWGACVDLDGDGNCDGIPDKSELDWANQGPFRVWRWDTPTSTPVLVYATLNTVASAIGQAGNSEMTWTRFGDAFDVVGKRSMYNPGNGQPQYLLDSSRIYTSGGSWLTQPEWNREVNMIIGDFRPAANRPVAEKGNKLDYRLGLKLVNETPGLSCHGVAATGTSDSQNIWMESCPKPATSASQVFFADYATNPAHALPQVHNQSTAGNRTLSSPLTGDAGTIEYFEISRNSRKVLITAGGRPTGGADTTIANKNTCAKVIDVTTPGQEFELFSWTPQLGNKTLANISSVDNYCSDVAYGWFLDTDGFHFVLFVLMSNNGIACYRSRWATSDTTGVDLTTIRGTLVNRNIELNWHVTSEKNNYRFEVQRSFDSGCNWELAGFVPGRGTTNVPYEYHFSDPLTPAHKSVGSVKYRLRQIDTDGKFTFSPVVDVYIGAIPSAIELLQNYPNPFNPTTTIKYHISRPGHIILKVFNPLGEEVAELVNEAKAAGSHRVSMKPDKLQSGVYVYELNLDGRTVQRKMVLVR